MRKIIIYSLINGLLASCKLPQNQAWYDTKLDVIEDYFRNEYAIPTSIEFFNAGSIDNGEFYFKKTLENVKDKKAYKQIRINATVKNGQLDENSWSIEYLKLFTWTKHKCECTQDDQGNDTDKTCPCKDNETNKCTDSSCKPDIPEWIVTTESIDGLSKEAIINSLIN